MSRTVLWLTMLAALLTCSGTVESFAAARIALVVGNSDYKNTSQLTNPKNDAALMAGTLEQSGFAVTKLIDADYRTMKKALLDFGRQMRDEETEASLFYYAGHGVQIKGENYLVPVDATITSEDEVDLETINVNSFLQVMNSSQSRINIVILDACRNNPFARSFRAVSRGLAPVQAPKGTWIAYATAPGDVASDGSGGNSPYTLSLTQAINEGAGEPIETVFKRARQRVLQLTEEEQVPWETSSITGDFYFRQDASDQGRQQVVPAAPQVSESPVSQAFEAARREGSQAAWSAFLSRFPDADVSYLSRANDALFKLKLAALSKAATKPDRPFASCAYATLGTLSGELCATSVLDPQYGNRYGGVNLGDNQLRTAWVEGVAGDGIGQSVLISFDSPKTINGIRLVNGYAKNGDIFAKNGRVRELLVATSSGYSQTITLHDNSDWQRLDLPPLNDVSWIMLEIGSVYRGSKYKDTAISELRFE
ncbi:caspase family protein [Rhizobium sp. L1K21]|uniref:NADase-type glycan-binding domain-containing protein n=1 Tax=Rhizobium sp. L1K21 TaxID=2954933 RepID=UPI00209326D3|nr:caspase family protein [Rhizobium sp. L1K21]MCO6184647.1 caspase family protein [Rhizobium sp. L1K21]